MHKGAVFFAGRKEGTSVYIENYPSECFFLLLYPLCVLFSFGGAIGLQEIRAEGWRRVGFDSVSESWRWSLGFRLSLMVRKGNPKP